MTHNIVVGSRVKVLSSEGSFAYKDKIGQIMTVLEISHGARPSEDIIHCMIGHGQYPRRFELQLETNGVDASGKPLNFTLSMLKPLQRVVTRKGQSAIVAQKANGDVVILYSGHGFDYGHLGTEDRSANSGNSDIVEVYDAPTRTLSLLTHGENGALVWKETDATAKAARVALLVKLGIARDEAYAAYVEATRVLEAF